MIKKFFAAMILAIIVAAAQNVDAAPYITYRGHVSGYGWMRPVGDGQVVGTTGEDRALEAVIINFDGGIRYRSHVKNIGWQGWAYSGQVSGTVGEGLHMEAICIELEGSAAQYYDVYYRAHVKNRGWLDWVCNGEVAGTVGEGLRLEALQIRIVDKGSHFGRGNRHNRHPRYY